MDTREAPVVNTEKKKELNSSALALLEEAVLPCNDIDTGSDEVELKYFIYL